MYKSLLKTLAVFLGLGFLFVGCATDTSENNGAGNTPAEVKHSVTFYVDGAIYGSLRVLDGNTATKPADDPKKDGYEFNGWYIGTEEYDFSAPVKNDLVITAKWTEKQSTTPGGNEPGTEPDPETTYWNVIFNSNGGSSVTTQKVENEKTAARPQAPSKADYTFDDWYTDAQFSAKYNFGTPVTAGITLYAKYTPVKYSVKYMNGTTELTGLTPVEYTVEDEDLALPASVELSGYTFDGWLDAAGQKAVKIPAGSSGNLVFKAAWKTNVSVSVTIPEADDAVSTPELTVAVDGSKVTVTCGEAFSTYKWTLAKGAVTETMDSTGRTVTKDCSGLNGLYSVILTATDSAGKVHSAFVNLTIINE